MPSRLDQIRAQADSQPVNGINIIIPREDVRLLLDVVNAASIVKWADSDMEVVAHGMWVDDFEALRAALAPLLEDEDG